MESLQIVWWVLLAMLILTQVACIGKGIQPNPMYRVINRRVLRGGNHGIHPAIMGAMSFVSLSVGLITGLLVYFLIMRAMTRSVE